MPFSSNILYVCIFPHISHYFFLLFGNILTFRHQKIEDDGISAKVINHHPMQPLKNIKVDYKIQQRLRNKLLIITIITITKIVLLKQQIKQKYKLNQLKCN